MPMMIRMALLLLTLALSGCQPASTPDLTIPGANPVAYEAVRDASGILGYAESMLGPDIATSSSSAVGPGASLVDPARVVGAWELPAATTIEDVSNLLDGRGDISKAATYRGGQLWIADYTTAGTASVRLLLIDGNNPTFETQAAPEVRPGPHIYLIAYRRP